MGRRISKDYLIWISKDNLHVEVRKLFSKIRNGIFKEYQKVFIGNPSEVILSIVSVEYNKNVSKAIFQNDI